MSARSMLVACIVLGSLFYVVTFFPSVAPPTSSSNPVAFAVAQAPKSSNVKAKETYSAGQPADLSASAIAALIVQESRNAYYATGHPCACPDDLMRNGRRCGGNSAYIRPGGAHPLCSAADVSAEMISQYRARLAR
jgi:hypothetical protein